MRAFKTCLAALGAVLMVVLSIVAAPTAQAADVLNPQRLGITVPLDGLGVRQNGTNTSILGVGRDPCNQVWEARSNGDRWVCGANSDKAIMLMILLAPGAPEDANSIMDRAMKFYSPSAAARDAHSDCSLAGAIYFCHFDGDNNRLGAYMRVVKTSQGLVVVMATEPYRAFTDWAYRAREALNGITITPVAAK